MKFFLIFLSIFFLAACTEPSSPNLKNSGFSGHIVPSDSPQSAAPIPQLARANVLNPPPKAEISQNVYTLSAIEAPVHEVLFRLGEMANYQVDIHPGIGGFITINAVQQTLPNILVRIADQLGLIINVGDKTINARLDQPYWQEYYLDYVNIIRTSSNVISMNMTVGETTSGSSSTVNVSSEYDFWSSLISNIESIVSQDAQRATSQLAESGELAGMASSAADESAMRRVVANPEAGILLVFARQQQHRQVSSYVNSVLRRSERQVMIEASVVEVVLSEMHQSGIDWNVTGFGNILATAVGSGTIRTGVTTSLGADFGFALKALEEFGKVQVLSSPKIMAVNNQPALLKVVDNEVYFTIDVQRSTSTAGSETTYTTTVNTVPVGFMMTVTPFVSEDDQITLNVRPTISRIIDRVRDPNPDLSRSGVASLIPVIQEREMETVLRLRNNQTAVIGGLIEDRNVRRDQGLPGLARIPILGNTLFGHRERGTYKTELVVFIRPVIVDRPDIDRGDLMHFRPFLEAQQGFVR
ncbi:type II and III secretion system protein [Thiomicrospira sp. R3]|uniref:type II secretion system protein GspD n=1 Tax=Thiomicrospira sp. R3 TaxID=3035472 RepID=UPI00259B27D7|nr:type II and III secretion system protein [Thiomicrospira sp. R3]WFE68682.1 type II and III secretion system protein [Thiomicrospira sp. R3]